MFSTQEEAWGEEEDDILLRCRWRWLFSLHLCFFGESDSPSFDKTELWCFISLAWSRRHKLTRKANVTSLLLRLCCSTDVPGVLPRTATSSYFEGSCPSWLLYSDILGNMAASTSIHKSSFNQLIMKMHQFFGRHNTVIYCMYVYKYNCFFLLNIRNIDKYGQYNNIKCLTADIWTHQTLKPGWNKPFNLFPLPGRDGQ